MRRLILMRHAKSSWADPGQADVDRPLNDRGRRAAAAVGKWLAEQDIVPDAALVSISTRTRETWAGLGPAFADVPMTPVAALYHAGRQALLATLRGAPDVPCVLILAHHPGIAEFARDLLGDVPEHPGVEKYPTAATAVIDFDIPAWDAADWRQGRLVKFVTPKELA
jgi:phosphohistidine phosphatase